jgi:PhnB protein
MTHINAYLHFNGNCREAMTFYKECLGGELTMQTVEESPMASPMPPESGQHIMHATLTKGNLVLMASDMMREQPIHGNAMSLMLNCSSEEEIKNCFASLASGGTVEYPLAEQFWGATYGELTDKFGLNWMLNYDKSQG